MLFIKKLNLRDDLHWVNKTTVASDQGVSGLLISLRASLVLFFEQKLIPGISLVLAELAGKQNIWTSC